MLERARQTITGVVVSDKMSKTRVIVTKVSKTHRLYGKAMLRDRKFFIHDEKNESQLGDKVQAVSCRPLSKEKHFRLSKVVEKRKLP